MLEGFKNSFLKAQQCSIPAQGQEEDRARDQEGFTESFGCAKEHMKQQHSARYSGV